MSETEVKEHFSFVYPHYEKLEKLDGKKDEDSEEWSGQEDQKDSDSDQEDNGQKA